MKRINYEEINPKEFANKSIKQNLANAIQLSLQTETDAVKRNTYVFNENRYKATSKLLDYETLKNKARIIKENAINDLPQLIISVKKIIESRGGNVFIANNSKEATEYIRNICTTKNAKLVVKSKSITSEEIGLNEVLEKAGIEVAETDLAEFILQISKEQPSHNVAPAIHLTRERISKLFKEAFDTNLPLETGEELTEFARDILREKFLKADIGISGVNCIAADSGSILLVESEGNIRLTTHLPATHIAISGIEKIIHNYSDLSVFIELLAASGTGQSLTSYTNILTPPLKSPILNLNQREDTVREFHLVLIDNGRMKMRDDPILNEALYCIRCSACMNVCANFQVVGGHAFGGECYTGGIGGAWAAGTSGDISNARFSELCTGCSRCIPNCPVKIDIPGLNTEIKNRIMEKEGGASFQKQFFGKFSRISRLASTFSQISNFISDLTITKLIMEKIIGFDSRRLVPKFSKNTMQQNYKSYRKQNNSVSGSETKVTLFADVFTNYNNAEIGLAVIRVFEKLGIDINLSKTLDDGRALLSQGMINEAKINAEKVIPYLLEIIKSGRDILVSEPSVLTMFLSEYKKFTNNESDLNLIIENCYDPIQYLNLLNEKGKLDRQLFKEKLNYEVFYHGHCQLKSVGLGKEVSQFCDYLSINITESKAECCGMAGSFGYKKEYYDISKKVGKHLGTEIDIAGFLSDGKIILASGVSCREQIFDEIRKKTHHPIEFIEKILL